MKEQIISREEAIERGLKRYFTGEPCKYGHVDQREISAGYCCECRRIRSNSPETLAYQKQYREKNRDKRNAQKRKHYQENKNSILEYQKDYYSENKEYVKKRVENYRQSEEGREKINAYRRKKYKEDELFWANRSCRRFIDRTCRLSGVTKNSKTHKILGYSSKEFWERMEECFQDGMTRDNRGEWHVEHIKPISRLLEDGVEDPGIINSLDNLIPMWAGHNLEKNNKTLKEWLSNKTKESEEWIMYSKFL